MRENEENEKQNYTCCQINCYLLSFFILIVGCAIFYFINHNAGKSNIKLNWNIFNNLKKDLDEKKYLFIETKINPNYKDDYHQNKYTKIVGIDFGTVDIGISYSLDNNINNIITNKKVLMK